MNSSILGFAFDFLVTISYININNLNLNQKTKMSDDESGEEQKEVIEPIPEHKMRFSDMPDNLVEKAIRRKLI